MVDMLSVVVVIGQSVIPAGLHWHIVVLVLQLLSLRLRLFLKHLKYLTLDSRVLISYSRL